MTALATATKRLWSRRLSKASDVTKRAGATSLSVAKRSASTAKSLLYRVLRTMWLAVWRPISWIPVEGWIVLAFALTFLGIPGGAIAWNFWGSKPASTESIQKAMSSDACVAHTLPRRAAEKDKALRNFDITRVIADCEEYWEEKKRREEQAKALGGK